MPLWSSPSFLLKFKKKRKKKTKFRLSADLPLDSSPWQIRAGVPSSHIACLRPPRSCSGFLDCPCFVRQRCVLDAGTDCIQHPTRGAAESKTGKKNEQIHASIHPVRFIQFPLSCSQLWQTVSDWTAPKTRGGRAQPSLEAATLIIGHAFLISTSQPHHSSASSRSSGK